MNIRRTAAVIGVAATLALSTGCATREIDVDRSGSVPVEGTSWMLFCRGDNAIYWVPGHSGENDELEAVIYDDEACIEPDTRFTTEDPARGDADGIIEDDE